MKKTITILLLILLSVSVLAGCGGETASPNSSTSEKPAASNASVDLKLIKELEQKNIKLVEVYNEVATLAVKNGWEADELTVKELNGANAVIKSFNSIINDPASAEGANLPELLSATDDLINELDTNFRKKVSKPLAK